MIDDGTRGTLTAVNLGECSNQIPGGFRGTLMDLDGIRWPCFNKVSSKLDVLLVSQKPSSSPSDSSISFLDKLPNRFQGPPTVNDLAEQREALSRVSDFFSFVDEAMTNLKNQLPTIPKTPETDAPIACFLSIKESAGTGSTSFETTYPPKMTCLWESQEFLLIVDPRPGATPSITVPGKPPGNSVSATPTQPVALSGLEGMIVQNLPHDELVSVCHEGSAHSVDIDPAALSNASSPQEINNNNVALCYQNFKPSKINSNKMSLLIGPPNTKSPKEQSLVNDESDSPALSNASSPQEINKNNVALCYQTVKPSKINSVKANDTSLLIGPPNTESPNEQSHGNDESD